MPAIILFSEVVVCRSEASESLFEGLGWLREAIIKRKGGEDDLDEMKLGKASHSSALMQKIKHILSPSLTRAWERRYTRFHSMSNKPFITNFSESWIKKKIFHWKKIHLKM